MSLRLVDDFVYNLSLPAVANFVHLVSHMLDEIRTGKRANWRHNILRGEIFLINGKRVMKHHLSFMSIDTADFKDEVTDMILDMLNSKHSCFDYNLKVLLPTIRLWVLIGLGKLTAPQARYYLAYGGHNSGEAAMKFMEAKCMLI